VHPTTQNSVSDCSTFLSLCDVPHTAVFCRGSIECYLLLVATPAAVIAVVVVIFIISLLNLLCIA